MNSFYQGKARFSYDKSYLCSSKPGLGVLEIWMVLHGYGQLAPFFLRKFRPLFHPKRLIIAPEGINHFYQEGYSGRVGANWMTSHERENDIKNTLSYLDEVLIETLQQIPITPTINVLGFSQGAATLSRWVAQSAHPVKKLVLWGGGLAHDLDVAAFRENISNTSIILAVGNRDEFLTPERQQEQETLWSKVNPGNRQIKTYDGGHELDDRLLHEIFTT